MNLLFPASDPGLTGYYGYRIQFAAGTPGAHLIFRIWTKYSGGNFGVNAATLQGLPALAGGTAVVTPASTVAVGSTINLQASGATGVYPLQYQWQMNSGAGYVNIPGATNASQLTTSGTAAVGSVSYQVVVTDSSGSVASTPVAVTVVAPTSTLIGSSVNVLGVNVNLSSEGLIDWSHWGYGGFAGHDVLSPVASQISQYTFVGTWGRSDFNVQTTYGGNTPWSWTNGTPDLTVTGDASMIERNTLLLGWEPTAPASTYEKVFNVYPSVALCALHMEAYLSDNSAPVFMDESFNGLNFTARRYSFRYSSPNAGAILHVRYWVRRRQRLRLRHPLQCDAGLWKHHEGGARPRWTSDGNLAGRHAADSSCGHRPLDTVWGNVAVYVHTNTCAAILPLPDSINCNNQWGTATIGGGSPLNWSTVSF